MCTPLLTVHLGILLDRGDAGDLKDELHLHKGNQAPQKPSRPLHVAAPVRQQAETEQSRQVEVQEELKQRETACVILELVFPNLARARESDTGVEQETHIPNGEHDTHDLRRRAASGAKGMGSLCTRPSCMAQRAALHLEAAIDVHSIAATVRPRV